MFEIQTKYVTVLLAYKATLQNAEIPDQWSLTEGGCFRESNHKGSLPRRGSDISTFVFFYGREFIVRNFLVTYTCSFMLSLKVPCMRPGGELMKGVGMLFRNFELNP